MPLSSAFFFPCYLYVSLWEVKQLVYYLLFKDGGKIVCARVDT